MGKSCKEVAQSLVECMKTTMCVTSGGDMKECMKTAEECQDLRVMYFNCKRQGLDMRTRIKGPKAF